jgi:Tol biopolymer transport system component
MRFAFLFFLFLFWIPVTRAQEVLENNPPSIKWSQVNTPHFRVVFPRGFDTEAQRVASTLEGIHQAEGRSLGSYPRKISVILQTQSSESNGFVSMLPRRSEFFTMPSQNYNFTGTTDWLDLLASHEYRHIVQYQHAFRGFNKLFYYVFGAATFTGMSQLAAPDWFWEGDAVVTETAFTPGGRGKIPSFSRVFRTNFLEGRTFNYHKQYLRSYRHNIPDHYVLGYHMVSYLRKRTGDADVWGKITARAFSRPFVPFIFSSSIKKETGFTVNKLYREMVKDLKSEWEQENAAITPTPFQPFAHHRGNAYTDFLYPQPLPDGSALAMKKGIAHIEQFVTITEDGKEHAVFTPGFINDTGMLSSNGNIIVWNEFGYDVRWSMRNYSLIKAYDLGTKDVRVIGDRKARYAGSSISPDGSKIVTIRTGTDYQTNIMLLSYPDGATIKRFDNPQNVFYSMPSFTDDSQKFVVLSTARGRRSVILFDAAGKAEEIIGETKENIGSPMVAGGYLLYNSPANGVDNIFAVRISDKRCFQVTESRYGAYNPRITKDGKDIFYNEQGRNGLNVVRIPFDPSTWKPFDRSSGVDSSDYQHLIQQEGSPDLVNIVATSALPVKAYSKAAGLLNPYTWGFYFENSVNEANVGIGSQDLLSTTRLQAGFVYNIAERAPGWQVAGSYQGFFPIIDIKATYFNRRVIETVSDEDYTFDWLERTVEGGLRVPLIATSGKFATTISGGASAGLINVSNFTNNVDDGGRQVEGNFFADYVDNGNLIFGHVNLVANRLLKRSRRDINSRWGQRLYIDHYTTPFGGDFRGQLSAMTGYLYFPGLFRQHSLWGHGAVQLSSVANEDDIYLFQSQVPHPRGLAISRFERLYSFGGNYTFPLVYPDIALGPVLNFQRVRANLFFDYALGNNSLLYSLRTYASTGVELKIDFNILRFLPQLDVGVRYSVGLQPSTTQVELLIGTINF